MNHGNKLRKFGRMAARRQSFVRNLMNNLIRYERIETTEARAKAIRPRVEKAVTMAKKQTLAARRILLSRLHNEEVVKKLWNDLAPRYANRPGGYLRIVKSSKARKRDGTRVAILEFVSETKN